MSATVLVGVGDGSRYGEPKSVVRVVEAKEYNGTVHVRLDIDQTNMTFLFDDPEVAVEVFARLSSAVAVAAGIALAKKSGQLTLDEVAQ